MADTSANQAVNDSSVVMGHMFSPNILSQEGQPDQITAR